MNLDIIAINISNIQFDWKDKYGYFPTIFELKNAWSDGDLLLSDIQEDCLIQWLEIENLLN